MYSYSILPVNDPQEIAKLGLFEASFTKLITKVYKRHILFNLTIDWLIKLINSKPMRC